MLRSLRPLLRLFGVITLITLLPLRAWMGDAMAVGMGSKMVASAMVSSKSIAANAHQASATVDFSSPPASAMPADCAMHASEQSESASCAGCDTCGLCVSAALPASTLVQRILTIHPPASPVTKVAFASAERQAGLKPPIA